MKANRKILLLISTLLIFTLGCNLSGAIRALFDNEEQNSGAVAPASNQRPEEPRETAEATDINPKRDSSSETIPPIDWGEPASGDTPDDVTL